MLNFIEGSFEPQKDSSNWGKLCALEISHHVQEEAQCQLLPSVLCGGSSDLLTSNKIKTLAPLRSSDRRKITDQIISEYQLQIPNEEVVSDSANERTSISIGTLRNSLLPDGSLWAKFSTTVGVDLKTVQGTLYVGTIPGEEQRILWFRVDERTYPTGQTRSS